MPYKQCEHGISIKDCKICKRKMHKYYQRQWRTAHLDHYREYQREWRYEHPGYFRKYLAWWKRMRGNKLLGSQQVERIVQAKNDDDLLEALEREMKRLRLK